MSTRRFTSLWMVTLVAALFAAGCSEDPVGTEPVGVGGDNTIETIDLNQPYGGLAYTDEAPAFGDAELQAESESEDAVAVMEDDEASLMASDPVVRDMAGHADLVRLNLRIVWGHLEGRPADRPDATLPPDSRLDWTGGLQVSNGAVIVRKTILFERPFDHLLPRNDRQAVEWVSHTGPHVDGILVTILARPDSTGALEGSLSFRTGPFSESFRLADIDGLEEIFRVDQMGNGVSFFGYRPDPCPSGFLGGYWKDNPDRPGGVFRGRWVSQTGRLRGFLMGHYGVNDAGERVFAGKILDRQGHIVGLLGGTYQPVEEGAGIFQGRWVTRRGDLMGVLAGRYATSPRLDAGGFFQGRWKTLCPEADTL